MKNGVRENILKCISFVHFVSNKTDHFVFPLACDIQNKEMFSWKMFDIHLNINYDK
jgi:aspartyl/asparaginyl beta-hydroxylase (cupin superfamily)